MARKGIFHSKRDRKYKKTIQIALDEIDIDCQKLLLQIYDMSSSKDWISTYGCIKVLGMSQDYGGKKVSELERLGLLEYRTGSRQPGSWIGTPSVVLTNEGFRIARLCKKDTKT